MPLHLKACTIAAFLILWVFLAALREGPRVQVKLPALIASEPADMWMLVTVDPRAENRLLVLEVDGMPGEYRRSDVALEGEKAARLRQIWWKGLRAGCYIFSASVFDTSHRLASAASQPLHVIGREGDPCA